MRAKRAPTSLSRTRRATCWSGSRGSARHPLHSSRTPSTLSSVRHRRDGGREPEELSEELHESEIPDLPPPAEQPVRARDSKRALPLDQRRADDVCHIYVPFRSCGPRRSAALRCSSGSCLSRPRSTACYPRAHHPSMNARWRANCSWNPRRRARGHSGCPSASTLLRSARGACSTEEWPSPRR